MKPEVCNNRIEELTTQIQQLDETRQALQDQRTALDLPALKLDFLDEILSNLQGVIDAVPAPQKKHLLHLLVKKVLIRDRHTFEVWYRLPQFPGVRILGQLAAPRGQCANKLKFPHSMPTGQATFCLSTSSRYFEGLLKDVRVRLAG